MTRFMLDEIMGISSCPVPQRLPGSTYVVIDVLSSTGKDFSIAIIHPLKLPKSAFQVSLKLISSAKELFNVRLAIGVLTNVLKARKETRIDLPNCVHNGIVSLEELVEEYLQSPEISR